jgi:predicted dehydrogenase
MMSCWRIPLSMLSTYLCRIPKHAHWTVAAARAGKAILCEKPLAMSAAAAGAVALACSDHKVLLMEGFMYRFHPQHDRVREIIASGEIGGRSRGPRSPFSLIS